MSVSEARTVRVAAVQMASADGDVTGNLERAVAPVEEAAGRGAELVLLPEFLPTGYLLTKDVWSAAEPRDGLTVRWLREHARRLGIHLGTSFLEAEGEDFFNTFVLVGPGGEEAGRVRKQTPALFEAYFTRGDAGSHVVRTALGTIGVGICYENMLAYTGRLMHEHAVDLMLMPHSAPSPARRLATGWLVRTFEETLRSLPEHHARVLGIPVVLCNKCGPWDSPLPGLPLLRQSSRFSGLSAIADSDGTLLAQLGAGPGVIVEDVTLDPSRKSGAAPDCRGRWAIDLPAAANVFRAIEAAGGAWYRLSAERKRRARRIARGG